MKTEKPAQQMLQKKKKKTFLNLVNYDGRFILNLADFLIQKLYRNLQRGNISHEKTFPKLKDIV